MHMTHTKPTKPGWYWHRYANADKTEVSPARVLLIGDQLHWNGWTPWDLVEGDWDPLVDQDPEDLWSSAPIPFPAGMTLITSRPVVAKGYRPRRRMACMDN